jgi:hypothetical protein
MESFIPLMLFLFFYFLPTFVAKPGRRGSVFVINLFFGWTLLGWVIALYMAVRSVEAAKGVV